MGPELLTSFNCRTCGNAISVHKDGSHLQGGINPMYEPKVGDVVVALSTTGSHIGTVLETAMGRNSIKVRHYPWGGAFNAVAIWPSTSLRLATAVERQSISDGGVR